jgi:hypothetical protein
MGTAAFGNTYPWVNSIIYDAFGTTERKFFDPAPSLATWHVYEISSASAAWSSYLDGLQLFTTETNTVGFPAAPTLGFSTVSNYYFLGDMAEVLLYPSALSAADRLTVRAYLGNKFGILLAGSPTRSATDNIASADSAARAGALHVRSASDNTTGSDSAARLAIARVRSASDTITSVDTATRATTSRQRTAADTTTVSDTAFDGITVPARSATDSATSTDTAIRAVIFRAKTANDSLTVQSTIAIRFNSRNDISRCKERCRSTTISSGYWANAYGHRSIRKHVSVGK